MKKLLGMFGIFFCMMSPQLLRAQESAPLKLVQKYAMPGNITGHFDHFAIDLQGNRLFATPEAFNAVLVFDVGSGKMIHTISGIAVPHALVYRGDNQRLYVTYGGGGAPGGVKVLDGRTYNLIQDIKLLPDADPLAYDPVTKYLYVNNGGGDAHQSYAMLSAVDTNSMKKLNDFKVPGETLESIALEKSSSKMYVNNRAKNQVEVIDRKSGTILASWPVTMGKDNVPLALDETNHRLFVACRSGNIVVFDTETGKELQSLLIGKVVDDLVFDAASKRLYAPCGGDAGEVDVYQEQDPNHYQLLGKVPSGPGGKTALLVPSLKKYFVAVPSHASTPAQVYVYDVQ
jgi:DNA-binding beta-propeller fold protein YncE